MTSPLRQRRLRMPPYAARLAERLASGWLPSGKTLHVAAGPSAWNLAQLWEQEPGWRGFFAVPEREFYDLAVVRGFDTIVHRCGLLDDEIEPLARELLKAGAARVVTTIENEIVVFKAKFV